MDIRWVDILDIAFSAYLMYVTYKVIRGTLAGKIMLSIFAFLVLWIVVRALNMSMLSAVMGSFVNIGLIALIIIFQPEIRSFLVLVSTRYSFLKRFGIDKALSNGETNESGSSMLSSIVNSCGHMSETFTGALIVVARTSGLEEFVSTGEEVHAQFSQRLIESLFFKNSPLHDGAMIVTRHEIVAAGCILPVSKSMSVPKSFGLRHRSALGITEVTDAIAIVVSEETGSVSVFDAGVHIPMPTVDDLAQYLEKQL